MAAVVVVVVLEWYVAVAAVVAVEVVGMVVLEWYVAVVAVEVVGVVVEWYVEVVGVVVVGRDPEVPSAAQHSVLVTGSDRDRQPQTASVGRVELCTTAVTRLLTQLMVTPVMD